jgi:hypothetical protein
VFGKVRRGTLQTRLAYGMRHKIFSKGVYYALRKKTLTINLVNVI